MKCHTVDLPQTALPQVHICCWYCHLPHAQEIKENWGHSVCQFVQAKHLFPSMAAEAEQDKNCWEFCHLCKKFTNQELSAFIGDIQIP